jgi:hypothetical protein
MYQTKPALLPYAARFYMSSVRGLLTVYRVVYCRGGREVNPDERMALLHTLMESPVEDTLRVRHYLTSCGLGFRVLLPYT